MDHTYVVYLNNILIYLERKEDYDAHVKEILNRLVE